MEILKQSDSKLVEPTSIKEPETPKALFEDEIPKDETEKPDFNDIEEPILEVYGDSEKVEAIRKALKGIKGITLKM